MPRPLFKVKSKLIWHIVNLEHPTPIAQTRANTLFIHFIKPLGQCFRLSITFDVYNMQGHSNFTPKHTNQCYPPSYFVVAQRVRSGICNLQRSKVLHLLKRTPSNHFEQSNPFWIQSLPRHLNAWISLQGLQQVKANNSTSKAFVFLATLAFSWGSEGKENWKISLKEDAHDSLTLQAAVSMQAKRTSITAKANNQPKDQPSFFAHFCMCDLTPLPSVA